MICSANQMIVSILKYNTRLKYNNATPLLLNKYLLKCTHHMLDVLLLKITQFNISTLLPIGLKDQSDLHKILYIFYESKTCTLRLVFLPMFFGEDWTHNHFEGSEGRISSKTFSVKWNWQPLRRLGLMLRKPQENNLMFFRS